MRLGISSVAAGFDSVVSSHTPILGVLSVHQEAQWRRMTASDPKWFWLMDGITDFSKSTLRSPLQRRHQGRSLRRSPHQPSSSLCLIRSLPPFLPCGAAAAGVQSSKFRSSPPIIQAARGRGPSGRASEGNHVDVLMVSSAHVKSERRSSSTSVGGGGGGIK